MQFVSFFLFLVLVALQFSDVYMTAKIIKAGGRELNPVMKFMIDKLGLLPGLLTFKLVMLVLVAAFLMGSWPWMLIVVLLYGWVINHNWNQMRKKFG